MGLVFVQYAPQIFRNKNVADEKVKINYFYLVFFTFYYEVADNKGSKQQHISPSHNRPFR